MGWREEGGEVGGGFELGHFNSNGWGGRGVGGGGGEYWGIGGGGA